MANNIIIDVAEINQAIQDIKDLKSQLAKEQHVINGLQSQVNGAKIWANTYALGPKWIDNKQTNGYHTRSLHIPFTKSGFKTTPNVQLTIESFHADWYSIGASPINSSGCTIHVVKKNKTVFSTIDWTVKVHIMAVGT